MSDNPMLRVAEMANRISSGSLEAIGKIQQDTYDRKLKREQLEQQTIEREAKLRVQSENYEARTNNAALVAEQRAIIATNSDDIRRKEELAAQLEERAKLVQGEIPRLEIERDLAAAEGKDTSSLDAAIAGARSQMAGIREQQSQVITGLMQPSTPVPTTAAKTSVVPYPQVQNPDAMGFDRYGDEAVNPTGGTERFYGPAGNENEMPPVEIKGLNYNDEELDLMVRTVAAEVGTQVDDDGLVMMAETIRNRHLMTGKPFSEILKPNYYETMRGENPRVNQIAPDSEVYQKSAAAVRKALAGSNLSDSATHNYYAPQWTDDAAKRNQADPATVNKYQKEVYYKKQGESAFNFNNYVKGEVEINLDVPTTNAGRQEMSGGPGVIDAGLFPPASRPDGGDNLILSSGTQSAQKQVADDAPLIATPLIEQDADLVANVDFFSSMEGDESAPVRFSDSGAVATPAQPDNFVYDNFFNPVDPIQSPTGTPAPKENPVNMEFLKKINTTYNALPEKDKALYQSRVQETIKRSNPTVADEEILALARVDAEREGYSSVEFRKALPDYIKNTVGEDYAVQKFIEVQADVKKTRAMEQDKTKLESRFKSVTDEIFDVRQKIAKEKALLTDANPELIGILSERESELRNELNDVDSRLKSFNAPSIQIQGPPSELQMPEESPLVQAARGLAVAPVPEPVATDMNTGITTELKKFGIDPKYLGNLSLEDDMSAWDKITASFGLNSNVNENEVVIRNAFIHSRAEMAINKESKDMLLNGAVEYFNMNREQVLDYASNLKNISLKDDSGKTVTFYQPFATEADDIVNEGGGREAQEKALLANPAMLYGIIDSMRNFDTNIKSKIVGMANKARQRKIAELEAMFGNAMELPADK